MIAKTFLNAFVIFPASMLELIIVWENKSFHIHHSINYKAHSASKTLQGKTKDFRANNCLQTQWMKIETSLLMNQGENLSTEHSLANAAKWAEKAEGYHRSCQQYSRAPEGMITYYFLQLLSIQLLPHLKGVFNKNNNDDDFCIQTVFVGSDRAQTVGHLNPTCEIRLQQNQSYLTYICVVYNWYAVQKPCVQGPTKKTFSGGLGCRTFAQYVNHWKATHAYDSGYKNVQTT